MLYCTYNLYKGKIMKRVYLSKGWVFAFLLICLKQVNVSRVRVILDELFMGAKKGMTWKSIRKTFYSNWVDVSNEDFSAVLHR